MRSTPMPVRAMMRKRGPMRSITSPVTNVCPTTIMASAVDASAYQSLRSPTLLTETVARPSSTARASGCSALPVHMCACGMFFDLSFLFRLTPSAGGHQGSRRGGGGGDERWGPLWPPASCSHDRNDAPHPRATQASLRKRSPLAGGHQGSRRGGGGVDERWGPLWPPASCSHDRNDAPHPRATQAAPPPILSAPAPTGNAPHSRATQASPPLILSAPAPT